MKGPSEKSTAERSSLASTKADLRELKTNSSATVQELQQFLRELRGKSPQEMLGVVASSQLMRATILAFVLVTAVIFVLTAFPYFFGDEPAAAPEPESRPAVSATPVPVTPINEPQSRTQETQETPGPLAPFGVNEKLPAAPNENPLEDKGEDFLKDLE
jgi:hypothetical protein